MRNGCSRKNEVRGWKVALYLCHVHVLSDLFHAPVHDVLYLYLEVNEYDPIVNEISWRMAQLVIPFLVWKNPLMKKDDVAVAVDELLV